MTDTNAQSEKKLGTDSIWKLMISMGLPIMIAQIVNILYSIVDRIYIGRIEGIGSDALAGLGVTNPIIIIISAFASFAGAGGAPLASIAMGKGEKDRAEKIIGNCASMLIVFSIILVIIFYLIKKPFLYAVGASDITYKYADSYISVYLLGTLFVQIAVGLNMFITAQGKSGIAMASVLIGAATNIILDPILIFGFDMGVYGAAIATVFSQFLSAVWVLSFLMSKRASLRIKPRNLRPDFKLIGSIAALGVSPFIMQATEAMISIVLNSGLQKYGGDLYVASLTILQSVMQLITTPLNGFAQGVQPIMSYNYGSGNTDRVKITFKRLAVIMICVSAVLTLSAIIFPGFYGSLFNDDPQLIGLIEKVLPVFMFGMLIFGLQMSCQSTFIALGQSKISLFIALLRKVILLIPFALIFPVILGGDVMGVYYAEPAADIIAAVICGIIFSCTFKNILNKEH